MLVKSKPTNNPCKIGALVNISFSLIPSRDHFKAKNAVRGNTTQNREGA